MNKIPKYGTPEYGIYAYNLMKENNRGHNYEYFNEDKWKKYQESGYKMHEFADTRGGNIFATQSEYGAKEIVKNYKNDGYYARIIAGYHKTVQRIKFFTIIFKKK